MAPSSPLGVADGSSERLRHWDLVTIASLGIDLFHTNPWCRAAAYDCNYRPFHAWSASWSATFEFWLLLPAMPPYLGFLLRTSRSLAALLWSLVSKSYDWFFSQALKILHGKGNFLVIQLPGLAMDWMAPVSLHGCLLTPPGSVHLRILALFTSQ